MDLKAVRWDGVDWMHLASGFIKGEKFLTE
jgi:hypothetical protein